MKYTKDSKFILNPYSTSIKKDIVAGIKKFKGSAGVVISNNIQTMFLSDLDTRGGEIPFNPTVKEGGQYRVMSSLQKAIRRGDLGAAFKAAIALYNYDEHYIWRVLPGVALAEVGIANLQLIALGLEY